MGIGAEKYDCLERRRSALDNAVREERMKSALEVLAKITGYACSISGIWVYFKSIYMPFKDGSFVKMICMIILPPFAQIYLFIAEWIKHGFLNEYGITCLTFVLLCVMCFLLIGLRSICWPEQEDSRWTWRIPSAIGVVVLLLLAVYGFFCLVCSMIEIKNIQTKDTLYTPITKVLGVQFGDKPDASFKFVTGDSMHDTYEFFPKIRFRGYDHFVTVVSKKTKLIHTIRAQKDFKDADDAKFEVQILKNIMEEKYKVRFERTENGTLIAKNGEMVDDMQILIISSGGDGDGKHIVIFSILDVKSAKRAMVEIGVTKESFETDLNAL